MSKSSKVGGVVESYHAVGKAEDDSEEELLEEYAEHIGLRKCKKHDR